jgi:hypothetical protein
MLNPTVLDTRPKPDKFGHGYHFLLMGMDTKFYLQAMYSWVGICSTQSEPNLLPSIPLSQPLHI